MFCVAVVVVVELIVRFIAHSFAIDIVGCMQKIGASFLLLAEWDAGPVALAFAVIQTRAYSIWGRLRARNDAAFVREDRFEPGFLRFL